MAAFACLGVFSHERHPKLYCLSVFNVGRNCVQKFQVMKLIPAVITFQFCSLLLSQPILATSAHGQQQVTLNNEMIRSNLLLSLHRDLVEIESISLNEQSIGNYLVKYLSQHNFTVEKQYLKPLNSKQAPEKYHSSEASRFNILAYRGSSPKSRILVSSHIDTVPPFWPYEVRKHSEIWGRGTVDAKGCVATQIKAVEDLLTSGDIKDGDVALLFVVGEELGGDGMKRANDLNLTWETAIFGEPTELKLASGHKGNLGFKIRAKGKAGHSGYPWLGESANSMLIPALAALDKLELPSSEKYGNSTVNIGRMEGGVAGNVIAETAMAQVQIRLASGTAGDVKKIVLDAIKKIDDRLTFEFASTGYGPVYIDSDVEGL